MIDLFCRMYSKIGYEKSLSKIKYYSYLRLILRVLLNISAPIYFLFTQGNSKYRIVKRNNGESPMLIVSLTTFPARINRIWLVVECMLRQTYKPNKIILWLSLEQFKNLEVLPIKLKRLQKRGLEIVLCDEDLRSHKKYFYTLNKFPNDIMITIDDDFIYPTTLIEDLVNLHNEFPDAICCDRAFKINKNGVKILPYNQWEYLQTRLGPSFNIFQTSGGGTLYPPESLAKEVLNKEVFMKYCIHADDIWLNIMSQMNNTKVVKTNCNRGLIPILNFNNRSLTEINVQLGQNDKQLEDVRNFYIQQNHSDPFKNLFL